VYSTDDSRVRRAGVFWGVDGRFVQLMVLDAEIVVGREAVCAECVGSEAVGSEAVGSVHHDATPKKAKARCARHRVGVDGATNHSERYAIRGIWDLCNWPRLRVYNTCNFPFGINTRKTKLFNTKKTKAATQTAEYDGWDCNVCNIRLKQHEAA